MLRLFPSAKLLYSIVTLIAPYLVLPVFFCFKRGRERILDRIGFWNCRFDSSIWMHGASLGETIGLLPVALQLKQKLPSVALFGSSTSPTALHKMKQFCADARLLPFDHPVYFSNCSAQINPKIFVFSETEVWPNLLFYLNKKNVPVILINGKVSSSSFALYKRFGTLFGAALQTVKFIFAADQESAERFLALGVKPENLELLANTKYDQPQIAELNCQEKMEKRKKLFKNEFPLIIFASLRPGEEKLVFEAIKKANESGLKLNYIVAPRHQEKFAFFENALKIQALTYLKRSQQNDPTEDLLFLDTHGELVSLLSIADLSFVGGTLVDGYGGHNPLEAAQFAVPLAVGQFDYRVRDIVSRLEASKAAIYVKTVDDLIAAFKMPAEELQQMGLNAKKVCYSFAGSSKIAANKICSIIEEAK